MTGRVLVIGLDPERIEGGWDPAPVLAGLDRARARFADLAIPFDECLVVPHEDPAGQIRSALTSAEYACVVVGGGIRGHEPLLALFEDTINLIREHAPNATIAFNTRPDDTADAALRRLP